MKSTDAEAPKVSRSIFAYGSFNQLFLGSIFGKLGDRLYQVALTVTAGIAFVGAAPESQVALIQIVATVPLFFAYSFMGTLIDTTDRRRLMYGVMLIKGVLVLGFVPLLMGIPNHIEMVKQYWIVDLALLFFISLVDSPFGPARASAVPDVAPPEHQQMGASLMATSGLISLLLGTFVGFLLAEPRYLGPANVSFVALGCYVISLFLLKFLPNAVAVPGNQRVKAEVVTPAVEIPVKKQSWGEYFHELSVGFSYCLKTRGIADLIFFETAFWCAASLFMIVFMWYLDHALHLRGEDLLPHAQAFAFGCAGVGLTIGAVCAGKLARTVTPIFTYPLSFVLMGVGVILMLGAPADIQNIQSPPSTDLKHGDYVLCSGPSQAKDKILAGRIEKLKKEDAENPASTETVWVKFDGSDVAQAVPISKLTLVLGALPNPLLLWLCATGLLVGFGGGMMLGRVDADILAIAPPEMRGRVFSVKATAFTMILMGSMGALSWSGEHGKIWVADWMGLGLVLMAIPAFFLAWRVDVSIWCKHADTAVPTGFHAFIYRLWRDMFWLFFKFMFRYEVVGSEKIPKTGPVILAANHGAFIDPLLLGSVTSRNVQYIMFRTYYESIAHPIFRFLRCIPVDSAGPLGALKAGIHSLEQGACIAIFPEGTVCADGKLHPPERGALFLAQRSGATVVPVAICGNHAAWPRQSKLPRFSKIKLIVGEPFVVPKELSKKEMAEMTDKLMRDLAALLQVEPPPSTADKIKDRGE